MNTLASTSWLPIEGRIALIAPASAVDPEVLKATLAELDRLGIEYRLSRHAQARYRYLAGTVEERLQDVHDAFTAPDIAAVWCLRGGYGCAQLLDGIDWQTLKTATPRPLIGYSDISILLSAFHRHGLPAIHGPVTTSLLIDPSCSVAEQQARQSSNASVSHLLAGRSTTLPVRYSSGPRHRVEGELIGGNLTALASMAGTQGALYMPEQALLVLEDIEEPYYRLERSLWQLLHSIDTSRLRAVCLGEFTRCPRKGVAHTLERIIRDYTTPLGIPLYRALPSGHGSHNHAWPYGRRAWLEGDRLSWTD